MKTFQHFNVKAKDEKQKTKIAESWVSKMSRVCARKRKRKPKHASDFLPHFNCATPLRNL